MWSSIEGSARHIDSNQEPIIAEFYEDDYDLLDPEVVAERLREKKLIEGKMDDMEVNCMGHCLVFGQDRFDKVLQKSSSPRQASQSEFEDLYFDAREVAWG